MRLLLLLALAAGGYYYWTQHQTPLAGTAPKAMVGSAPATTPSTPSTPEPPPSPNGFIALPPLDNGNPKQVVVFAPENCPAEDSQRADAMAKDLARRGIPSQRSHDISFSSTDPDPRIGQRLDALMKGDLPIVFVNGRGKSNPTLDQVAAEYSLIR